MTTKKGNPEQGSGPGGGRDSVVHPTKGGCARWRGSPRAGFGEGLQEKKDAKHQGMDQQ